MHSLEGGLCGYSRAEKSGKWFWASYEIDPAQRPPLTDTGHVIKMTEPEVENAVN